MFETVQETVDRLAATLARSVVLLDPEFVLVAHSRHYGDLDDVQVQLLAERHLDDELIASVQHVRGSQRHSAFLISHPLSALAERPRLFYPLRSERAVYGYLGVTLARTLTPFECAVIQETAHLLHHLLERTDQSILDINKTTEAEVLMLLSEDSSIRAEAALSLIDLGMFPQCRSFVALCLRTESDWTNTTGPPLRPIVSRVLYRATTAPMIHSYTFVPATPEAFVMIGFSGEPIREALQNVVTGIERGLLLEGENAPIVGRVGVGGAAYSLTATWQSYDQARVATEIARANGRGHAYWSDEGVAASALALVAPPTESHLVPDVVRRLKSAPAEVVELFEAYFDLSGNIANVAKRLHMHRSTVYLRLARAADGLGINFDDGESRFLIHAWLLQRRYYSLSGGETNELPDGY